MNMDKSIKWWLAKFIMIFHFCLVVWIFALPWISFELQWLLISILSNVALLTIWYISGTCPLNKLENYLLSNKHKDHNGLPKNNFIYVLAPIFGRHGEQIIYYLFSTIPLIGVTVACYRLFSYETTVSALRDLFTLGSDNV
jgi:hypothetical protein